MRRTILLTRDPISELWGMPDVAPSTAMGAIVNFHGVVRATEAGEPIVAIEYEAHEPMAVHQFGLLMNRVEQNWPQVESVSVVHRLGRVEAGEVSVWVVVVAPHRAEAFAACQFLIDEMKQTVPIWKRILR